MRHRVLPATHLRVGNVGFADLESAFGPSSLGILVVEGLPLRFLELRLRLLSYASALASLPSQELCRLKGLIAESQVTIERSCRS